MNGGDLPKGWRWVRLGEVAKVLYGKGLPKSERKPEGCFGVYGSNGIIDRTDKWLVDSPTIVIGRKGSVGALTLTQDKSWPIDTTFYLRLVNLRDVNLKCLFYALQKCDLLSQAIVTAVPGINRESIETAQIPLPPLPEQRRIVERIEELVSRIEEGKRLRHAAREETKAIMPATLCKIFSKANTQGWKHNRIAELITDIKTGTTPPSKETKYYGGNVQWFTPGDLGRSKYLIKSNRTLTATAIKAKKAKIFKEGTILFVGIGATLGKVGIAAAEVSSNQQITGLYFGPTIIPDFAYYWFRFKYDYIRLLSSAVTLPIINQDGLKNLVMEFPPLEEQRRIVTYLDRLQAKVEELRRLQEETQKELDAMISTTLDEAFKGKLCKIEG